MDSTIPLKVSCCIWHQHVSSRFFNPISLSFLLHMLQMLIWTGIWGILKPCQHLKLLSSPQHTYAWACAYVFSPKPQAVYPYPWQCQGPMRLFPVFCSAPSSCACLCLYSSITSQHCAHVWAKLYIQAHAHVQALAKDMAAPSFRSMPMSKPMSQSMQILMPTPKWLTTWSPVSCKELWSGSELHLPECPLLYGLQFPAALKPDHMLQIMHTCLHFAS